MLTKLGATNTKVNLRYLEHISTKLSELCSKITDNKKLKNVQFCPAPRFPGFHDSFLNPSLQSVSYH